VEEWASPADRSHPPWAPFQIKVVEFGVQIRWTEKSAVKIVESTQVNGKIRSRFFSIYFELKLEIWLMVVHNKTVTSFDTPFITIIIIQLACIHVFLQIRHRMKFRMYLKRPDIYMCTCRFSCWCTTILYAIASKCWTLRWEVSSIFKCALILFGQPWSKLMETGLNIVRDRSESLQSPGFSSGKTQAFVSVLNP
jgi:hypothetical protein